MKFLVLQITCLLGQCWGSWTLSTGANLLSKISRHNEYSLFVGVYSSYYSGMHKRYEFHWAAIQFSPSHLLTFSPWIYRSFVKHTTNGEMKDCKGFLLNPTEETERPVSLIYSELLRTQLYTNLSIFRTKILMISVWKDRNCCRWTK